MPTCAASPVVGIGLLTAVTVVAAGAVGAVVVVDPPDRPRPPPSTSRPTRLARSA